jgi:hypothetical protein
MELRRNWAPPSPVATVPIGFSAADGFMRAARVRHSIQEEATGARLRTARAMPPTAWPDGAPFRAVSSLLVSLMEAGAAHGDAGRILCAVRQWASFLGVPTIEGWRAT